MAKAKILTPTQYEMVKSRVREHSHRPLRDIVALAFSFRAGLRACEIAGLTWSDVKEPTGELRTKSFTVPNGIAKNGKGREVAMHPDVHAALVALMDSQTPALVKGKCPIVYANFGGAFTPNNMQKYLGRLYTTCGLEGVSSHSGRRTFITSLARLANRHECSLYDVQLLAGHSDLSTTEGYIEASDNVFNLVGAL